MSAATVLRRIAELYRAEAAVGGGMLGSAADEVLRLAGQQPAAEEPRRLPVCRYLATMRPAAQKGPLAAVAEAFFEAEPACAWRQNPNYTGPAANPAFLDRYGYVELVGRQRRWHSDTLAVGFLVLGPDTHYPPHHHPAAEVYHVVAGRAQWRHGDGPLAARPAGDAIYHAPGVVHETATTAEPLLALYCWAGEIATFASLTGR